MKAIAFFNYKGGVGKTTSSINVAYELAEKNNKKVLIIDLDPQGNISNFFVKMTEEMNPLGDLLLSYCKESEPSVKINDVIINTNYKNIDIIPTQKTLEKYITSIKDIKEIPNQFLLQYAFEDLTKDYDYIVLDCSPSDSIVNIMGLAIADCIFVPVSCDQFSLEGIVSVYSVMKQVVRYNRKLKLGGVFINLWENRNYDKYIKSELVEKIGDKFIDVQIHKNVTAKEISSFGKPLGEYDPNGKATNDFHNLTKKIMQIVD